MIIKILVYLIPIVLVASYDIYYFTHNKTIISPKEREKQIRKLSATAQIYKDSGYDGSAESRKQKNIIDRTRNITSANSQWNAETYIDDEKFKKRNLITIIVLNIVMMPIVCLSIWQIIKLFM